MKAVILAGGLGTRLSEETSLRPKPMVEIGGRPILWHVMRTYYAFGIREFIVCLGYKGYVIKEYFSNYKLHMSDVTIDSRQEEISYWRRTAEDWCITLVDTGDVTMTGGRIRRVRHLLEDEEAFCLTYGDGVADVDVAGLIDFHRGHGRLATVTAVRPPSRFGVLGLEGTRVASFAEKPSNVGDRINGGFFVLSPKVLDLIAGDETIWENEPLETLAQSGELQAYMHDGFWQPMDTLRDKNLLEELWSSGEAPWRR